MHIALLLNSVSEDQTIPDQELELSLLRAAGVAILPFGDPLTIALWRTLGQQRNEAPGGWLLQARPVDNAGWERVTVAIEQTLEPRADDIIEDWIARAASFADEENLEEARRAYKQADRFLSQEHSPRRASVLVCISELERELGRTREAIESVEHALAIFPAHRGALRTRLDLALENHDSVTAASILSRLVPFAETDEERVATLGSAADNSLVGACDALEQALTIRARDSVLLERLRAVREAMGRFDRAVDAGVALAETLTEPAERARAFVAAADMCARRVGNVQRAVALYEAAIADDPTVSGAFEAIEQVLLSEQDYEGAEKAYSRQLDRLSGRNARSAEILLLDKLARLREEKLQNRRGAIQALDRLVELSPEDIEVRVRLAGLLEAEGHDDLALRCLEVAARLAPTRAACFEAIHRIAARKGDIDRSYTSAAVLVQLGEADLDQQMVYQQYAPETALPAFRTIDESDWDLLVPAGHDTNLTALLRCLEPAAVSLKLEQLQAGRRLRTFDPKERQDPERSTLSAVRTLAWVSQLLGLPLPEIYARADDIPGGVAIVPTATTALLLGKAATSGRTIPELAFLLARELSTLRAVGRLLTFFPSLSDLKGLITTAMGLVLGEAPRARDPLLGLSSRLPPEAREQLAEIAGTMAKEQSKIDLNGWVRGIEITGCRAGLLASDDITVAARMLAVDGRAIPGLSAADKIRDLASFSVSQKFHAIRSMTGLAARTAGRT